MTLSYSTTVLLTMIRIALWAFVVFVLLPRLLFGHRERGSTVANFVRMALAVIVLVQLLAGLHLFDVFSLGFALIVLAVSHASLVRRTGFRAPLGAAWRRLVIGMLDLLDQWDQRAGLFGKLETKIRLLLRDVCGAVGRALVTPWTYLFLGVGVVTAWLRLGDAARHPASDLPDYGVHLSWMKALAADRLYADGVYPRGAEALLQTVRRVVAVDEAALLRVVPGMLECLIAALVYLAVRRLGGQRGPALVGAALFGVVALTGWLPFVAPPNGDGIAMTMALVFVAPTIVFSAEAMAGGGRPALVLAAEAMACLFLVQPFVGVVVLAGLFGVCVVHLGFGAQALRRAAVVTLVGASAGWWRWSPWPSPSSPIGGRRAPACHPISCSSG